MNWELPLGWKWMPISSRVRRTSAQVGPADILPDWLYLGLEHVQSGTGEYTGVAAGTAAIRSAKFRFEPGDILYGKLRPNLRKCVVADHVGVCSTDLVPLRPINPDSAHLIAAQLRSELFTQQVMRLVGGANLPRVNMKDVLGLSLPVPPDEDSGRLHAIARSVVSLRQLQRSLESAVSAADGSATAELLGLAP